MDQSTIIVLVVVLVVFLLAGFAVYYYTPVKVTYTPFPNSNPICPTASCDIVAGTIQPDADACQAQCTANAQCNVAMYDCKNRFKDANCWLKHFTTLPPNSEKEDGFDFFVKKLE